MEAARSVAAADRGRLEEIEAGVALTVDRAYYVEYLPAQEIAVLPPRPTAAPRVLAASDSSFVASVSARWTINQSETLVWSLFRADLVDGSYRITAIFNRPDGEFPEPSEVAPLTGISQPGRDLLADVKDFREYVFQRGELPPDLPFMDNRLTTGLVDARSTFKEDEPWEEGTSTGRVAPATERVGFSIPLGQGVLSCGVVELTSTTRHRDGEPLRPSPVLGDLAVLVDDGLYSSFTVQGLDQICLRHGSSGKPEVIAVTSIRTTVTGQPLD